MCARVCECVRYHNVGILVVSSVSGHSLEHKLPDTAHKYYKKRKKRVEKFTNKKKKKEKRQERKTKSGTAGSTG